MTQEQLRMQMLAGIITEGQYKAKLNEDDINYLVIVSPQYGGYEDKEFLKIAWKMSIQELGTISQYRLGIKMVIINNGWQGMVRQWQQSFYGNRFSNSYMRNGMPNFAEVAKAYNIEGFSIQNIEMLEKIIESNTF
jgi:hypothetical protein